MGIFSFINDAGAKLMGQKTDSEKAADAVQAKIIANNNTANQLTKIVNNLNFDVDYFNCEVNGDKVSIFGTANSQETKEKVILVVGNTNGIAQVEDNINVVNPQPEAKFHTVSRGDTLGEIAKTFYGNTMKYPEIFEANKPMLEHPDKIYPGQVLRIPELN